MSRNVVKNTLIHGGIAEIQFIRRIRAIWSESSLGTFSQQQIRRFFIQKMLISFLFLNKNICCGYSLEAPRQGAPRQGASNEYSQHRFSSRNKKKIMWIPPLICSCDFEKPRVKCFSCGQRRLWIRLRGCAGWSESSLDAHIKRYVFDAHIQKDTFSTLMFSNVVA